MRQQTEQRTYGENDSLPVVTKTITQEKINRYADASGDHNRCDQRGSEVRDIKSADHLRHNNQAQRAEQPVDQHSRHVGIIRRWRSFVKRWA